MKRLGVLVCSSLLLNMSCGGEETTAPRKDLSIGMVIPFSSPIFGSDAAGWEGAALVAQQEINAAGGVLGSNLALDIRDSQGDSDIGNALMAELLDAHEAQIIIHGDGGATTGPAGEIVVGRGALFISSLSGSDLTGIDNDGTTNKDMLFQVPTLLAYSGVAAAQLAENDGHSTINMLHTGFGPTFTAGPNAASASAFEAAFMHLGGQVQARKGFASSDEDYRAHLGAILDPVPDAIYVSTPDTMGHGLLNTWATNFASYEGTWYLDGLLFTRTLFTAVTKRPNKIKGVLAGDPDLLLELETKVQAQLGQSPSSLSRLAENYDAVYLVALAISKAGSLDTLAVRDALREVSSPPGTAIGPGEYAKALQVIKSGGDIDYFGASGDIDFDADGQSTSDFFVWEVDGDEFATVPGTIDPKSLYDGCCTPQQ